MGKKARPKQERLAEKLLQTVSLSAFAYVKALNEAEQLVFGRSLGAFACSLGANGVPFGLFGCSFGANETPNAPFEVPFALFRFSFAPFRFSFGLFRFSFAPNEN